MPPGYGDQIQFQSGTPYGTSFISNNGELDPDETALEAAKFQGAPHGGHCGADQKRGVGRGSERSTDWESRLNGLVCSSLFDSFPNPLTATRIHDSRDHDSRDHDSRDHDSRDHVVSAFCCTSVCVCVNSPLPKSCHQHKIRYDESHLWPGFICESDFETGNPPCKRLTLTHSGKLLWLLLFLLNTNFLTRLDVADLSLTLAASPTISAELPAGRVVEVDLEFYEAASTPRAGWTEATALGGFPLYLAPAAQFNQ